MIYVIGTGPGKREYMTVEAIEAIEKSEVIVGYKTYIDLIRDMISDKEVLQNGMRQEVDRCKMALEISAEGKTVALISGGDSGVYGMAGLIQELNLSMDQKQEIKVIVGVTSSLSSAASLGAPLMNDFCHISLSDLITPWEVIEKRLKLASDADFVIAIYNPKSMGRPNHLKRAFELMSEFKDYKTPVGIVKNSGRENEEVYICEFGNMNFDICDMSTMVIVGNKESYIADGKIITPRGYRL